jgi:mono/diheme cytochrome c family protein
MTPMLSLIAAAIAFTAAATPTPAVAQAGAKPAAPAQRALIERGRYLVRTSGCNDCHTPGYTASGGKVDEKLWLTGDTLGWNGPWGTTYPTNLRLWMRDYTEASWLAKARSFQPRPPMPWFNVHAMTDADLRALHRYITSLGPVGEPAPAYLPPGQAPSGPVVRFPG